MGKLTKSTVKELIAHGLLVEGELEPVKVIGSSVTHESYTATAVLKAIKPSKTIKTKIPWSRIVDDLAH